MMKHETFEFILAKTIAQTLSRLKITNPGKGTVTLGYYCKRDPNALHYYLNYYLKNLSILFAGKLNIQILGEDFCWQKCFRGFPMGGPLPQCKNCVGIRFFPNLGVQKSAPKSRIKNEILCGREKLHHGHLTIF